MSDRLKAMMLGSFAGDALAMGPHWIYDTAVLKSDFGIVDEYRDHPEDGFHKGKKAGEFTHYGDQTLVLLESVAEKGGFDLDDFAQRWRDFFDTYQGYFDRATKGALANFEKGKGPSEASSGSNDLAGAGRIAPIALAHINNEDAFIRHARAQTAMTHGDPAVVDSAEFFAYATAQIVNAGADPVTAMEKAADREYESGNIREWFDKGMETLEDDTKGVIKRFGSSCHTPDAFPGVVHVIGRWRDDFKEALIQNTMAGGDSAARGMLAGMVLGAHNGMEKIPDSWVNGLAQKDRILDLVDKTMKS
ncbi:MAG: ADP-ribosylglycohydrolase family protein [Desulfatibacillaceae bacterium]